MDEDFRSRTGRARRAKTGARLMQAVFDVVDASGVSGLSIDSVCAAARLSRGSFYNYFDALDDLLIEMSKVLGGAINEEQVRLFERDSGSGAAIAGYLRYFVHRAASERSGTAVLLRTSPTHGAVTAQMRLRMTDTFGQALAAGEIDVTSLPVAIDVGLGVATAMLRRALDDGPLAERISEETAVLLRGLGVGKRRAVELAHRPLPPPPTVPLRAEVIRRGFQVHRSDTGDDGASESATCNTPWRVS